MQNRHHGEGGWAANYHLRAQIHICTQGRGCKESFAPTGDPNRTSVARNGGSAQSRYNGEGGLQITICIHRNLHPQEWAQIHSCTQGRGCKESFAPTGDPNHTSVARSGGSAQSRYNGEGGLQITICIHRNLHPQEWAQIHSCTQGRGCKESFAPTGDPNHTSVARSGGSAQSRYNGEGCLKITICVHRNLHPQEWAQIHSCNHGRGCK